MPIRCPDCGRQNDDDASFCVRCGARLGGSSNASGSYRKEPQPESHSLADMASVGPTHYVDKPRSGGNGPSASPAEKNATLYAVFTIVTIFVFPPLALLFGLLAKKASEQSRGWQWATAWVGIVIGALGLAGTLFSFGYAFFAR